MGRGVVRLTTPYPIRLTHVERAVFKAAAEANGESMAAFVRGAAMDRALDGRRRHASAVYDALAAAFHADTGMHAPGKDAPPSELEHPVSRANRATRWREWLSRNVPAMGVDTPGDTR